MHLSQEHLQHPLHLLGQVSARIVNLAYSPASPMSGLTVPGYALHQSTPCASLGEDA